MHAPYEVPRISVSGAAARRRRRRSHHHSHCPGPCGRGGVDAMTAPLGDDLRSALERGEFRGKPYEIYVARTPASGWRAARVVFVGGGPRGEINVERIRRMATTAAQAARQQRRARIGWADVEPGVIGDRGAHRDRCRRLRPREFRQRRPQEPQRRPVLHPRSASILTVRERADGGRQRRRRWASRSTPRAC